MDQVERNFCAFLSKLPDILATARGRFALLHDEEIKDFFDRAADAVAEGSKRFGQGAFSVQEVTEEVESLGFYSYAGGKVQA